MGCLSATPSCQIDAQVWYFFSAGSNVFLLPYLYVYFSAAGYTDAQLGIISVFRPWLSALANVSLPPLADRWQCHRLLLMATFTSAVLLRLCLSFAVTNYTLLLFFVLAAEFLGAPAGSVTDAVVVASSAEVSTHPILYAGWRALRLMAASTLTYAEMESDIRMAHAFGMG